MVAILLHSTSLLLDQHSCRKYLSRDMYLLPTYPHGQEIQRLRIEIWIPYNIRFPNELAIAFLR